MPKETRVLYDLRDIKAVRVKCGHCGVEQFIQPGRYKIAGAFVCQENVKHVLVKDSELSIALFKILEDLPKLLSPTDGSKPTLTVQLEFSDSEQAKKN